MFLSFIYSSDDWLPEPSQGELQVGMDMKKYQDKRYRIF